MRTLVIDIQGFNLDKDFIPKEICFYGDDQTMLHIVLQPEIPFNALSHKLKKQVRFAEKFLHGINYSSGMLQVDQLSGIFKNFVCGFDRIYTKGTNKVDYIKTQLKKVNGTQPILINLEHFEGVPNLMKSQQDCIFHRYNKHNCLCALSNAKLLYTWLMQKMD